MRIKTWINNRVKSFVQNHWPEKVSGIYCSYENDSSRLSDKNRYIQIPTPINDRLIHYEIIKDHIELHFEDAGDNKSGINAYMELINYLEEKTESNENLEWQDFLGGTSLKCQYRDKLNGIDDALEQLKTVIDYFDPLINGYLTQNSRIIGRSSIPVKDNHNLNNENIDLYEFNLEELYTFNLHIPNYQRIYCWEEKNVKCLLNDLTDHLFLKDGSAKYRLGTIILHHHGNLFDIIDGQQRLVTLALLLDALGVDTCLLDAKFESSEAKEYVCYNKYLVDNYVRKHILDRSVFLKMLLESIDFSVLILQNSSLDLAYLFFSNENSRGVALTDYDLLKAHHLRYIPDTLEKQSQKAADRWNQMIERGRIKENTDNGIPDYVRTLDTYLYQLRQWMRKASPETYPNDRHVKNEYEAAPTMPDLPPFGEHFDFKEPIQGGTHFFYYVEAHLDKYKRFRQTSEYKTFAANMPDYGSFQWYKNAIEALSFGYYEKFGDHCLADALVLIMRYLLEHRYGSGRVQKAAINSYVADGGVILMIDQASSATFFLAELYNLCKDYPVRYLQKMSPIQRRMRSSILVIRQKLIPLIFVESIKKFKL